MFTLAEYIQTLDNSHGILLLPSKRAVQLFKALLEQRSLSHKLKYIIALGELTDHPYAANILRERGRQDLLKPSISSLKRQFMLAKLCQSASDALGSYQINTNQALQLASQLSSLLDEFQRSQLDTAKLNTLAPDDYAEHWQKILDFLHIITHQWPKILAQENLLDPIHRRNEIYAALTQHWREQGTHEMVILAGSTGSNAAISNMMQYLAKSECGKVILPAMPAKAEQLYWQEIEPNHPFYYIKKLLEMLELKPNEVPTLADTADSPCQQFLQKAFAPKALAHTWQHSDVECSSDQLGILLKRAPTKHAQVEAITALCEQLLETHAAEDICIVSESVATSKLLAVALGARNIQAHAPETLQLLQNSWANWALQLLDAALNPLEPASMLAVLKHPAHQSEENLATVYFLEQEILRKFGPFYTLDSLLLKLQESKHELAAQSIALLETYHKKMKQPAAMLRRSKSGADYLAAHKMLLETFTKFPEQISAEKAEFDAFMKELESEFAYLGALQAADYRELLLNLMAQQKLDEFYDGTQHIHILPSAEARFLTCPYVMIADFNDGTWPGRAAINPWLSKNMQQSLGFDLDDMQASRMSHDFFMLTHAKQIWLFHTQQDAQARPSLPSPYLQRLYFCAKAHGIDLQIEEAKPNTANIEITPAPQPQPTPPASTRPSKLSITDLELLQRDPYSIYAKHILQLKPLDPLTADHNQATYGQLFHGVLERFVRSNAEISEDSIQVLLNLTESVASMLHIDQTLLQLWLPRLKTAYEFYLQKEAQRRPIINKLRVEQPLSMLLDIGGKQWEIYGRADRLEEHGDGSISVVDYKTGGTPLKRDIESHIALQLTASALMVAAQFKKPVDEVAYWKFEVKAFDDKPVYKKISEQGVLAEVKNHIETLLAQYDQSQMPFAAMPDSAIAPAYPAYAHLERYAEWV